MYLSDKKNGVPRNPDDHEELEVLLESFAKQVEEIVNEAENIQVSSVEPHLALAGVLGHCGWRTDSRCGTGFLVVTLRSLPCLPFTVAVRLPRPCDCLLRFISVYQLQQARASSLTRSLSVERPIDAGDRGAYPRLEPECPLGAGPESLHPDNGHRRRDARRGRVRHERTSSKSQKSPLPR